MRFHLRHLLLGVTVAAGVAWSIKLGVSRAQRNIEASRSTYAARLVAQMCVEHMKANHQAWPRRWDDLRDEFPACLARSGQTWTFADLERRVGVDWQADTAALTGGTQAGPVIWVADDPDFRFHGTTPEEVVKRYLQSAASSVK